MRLQPKEQSDQSEEQIEGKEFQPSSAAGDFGSHFSFSKAELILGFDFLTSFTTAGLLAARNTCGG